MGDENRETLERGNLSTKAATGRRKNNLPNFLLSVQLKYVKLGYHYMISHAMYLMLIPLLGVVSFHLSTVNVEDLVLICNHLGFNLLTLTSCSALIIFLGSFWFITRPRKVYLVDFACYEPGPEFMCSKEHFMELSKHAGSFTDENLAFQKKILERSGIGQKTYVAESLMKIPANLCMAEARKEAEMIIIGALDQLFAKTRVKAKDIGILVVNCGLFCPTPSLSAMVVNHYKLRGNILSYNLGGMACSAGLISIDLAQQLLQFH